MKKFLVVGSGAIGALALSTLLGGGIASADDYAGETYADASSAASDAGLSVTVAARVGDKASDDDCIVTRSQMAPFASANDGIHVDGQIQFYLNCNAAYATATTPGPSQGTAAARDAKAADDEKAAEEAAEAQQNELDELAAAGEVPGEAGQVATG